MSYKTLRKLLPELTRSLIESRQKVFADGGISEKYKRLMALNIAVVMRCEPCVRAHTEKLISIGITEEELAEALSVAILMCGSIAESWASKALEFYEEIKQRLAGEK